MKILVIGSGGREHTLIWKLKQCASVSRVFCAPGNPGMEQWSTRVDIPADNIQELRDFAVEQQIDLTVVGPEVPLVAGIVDEFQQEGLQIVGPDRRTAQLEGSKAFAKEFMNRYGIPTGHHVRVTRPEEGEAALEKFSLPVVIKADGLAAGKGVLICETASEATHALHQILVDRVFGEAGNEAVIEEHLTGTETSVLCFVDGETILPMVSSQDHKRIGDGDTGPNTGGMGTYSPNRVYTREVARRVEKEILTPTLKGIRQEKMDFRGILFVGLMITSEGPKVLEYNVRFGDPETQVVIPRLETDLCTVFRHIVNRSLSTLELKWNHQVAVCVVLASGGYPGAYQKGLPITGLDETAQEVLIFHAGTRRKNGRLLTDGGRVLNVVAMGDTVEEAREKVYRAVDRIQFEGKTFRRDIGLT